MMLRMKDLRKKAGLSQSDMAAQLGVTLRVYGAWEREETPLPFDKAVEIAVVLHCSLDELANREANKDNDEARTLLYSYSNLSDAGKKSVQDMVDFTLHKEKGK